MDIITDTTAMLDPIDALKSDHEAVRVVLGNLDGYLRKIAGQISDSLRKNLIGQLNEITSFVDKDLEIHFKKEENVLFPVLGNYIGIETGPIHVMLLEHEQSRKLSKEFKDAIIEYSADGEYENIVSKGDGLIQLLSEHIEKEDNILFNMAEMQLTNEEKNEIMGKMRTIK
jgi:hemerythrin-like domain-containing protein